MKWGWLLLAFGGVVILLSSELMPAHEEGLTTGVLLALGAAFFYALTAIIARNCIRSRAAYRLHSGSRRRR